MNSQNPSLDSLELLGASAISMAEIRAMLDRSFMLQDFEWSQIEDLATHIQLYRAKPRSIVFREGDPGDFLCIVLQGKLEILKRDTQQVDKSVATISAGRSLGEMALIDRDTRSATAIVLEPTLLAVLSNERFQAIIRDKPTLAIKLVLNIAKLISQRLRNTSSILADFLEQ